MNLLITGAFSCTEQQLDSIKALGHNIVFLQQEKDQLPCDYSWVEGIIGNGIFLYHPIEKFSSLKFIQLTSAGFDRVPMEYVREKGIKIFNARGVYSVPMAEYAVAGVLSLYKKLEFFFGNQKQHKWEKHRGVMELFGKTVLIVGAGNVGSECAKRFSAFGCKVYGADIVPVENENFIKVFSISELDTALKTADVVVLTLPLTKETKGLFNKSKFDLMKKGAVFVNIARGAIADTNDLTRALTKNLGGAVLDVFETEPLEENSLLWDMENVIITPHNSFVGEGNKKRLFDVVVSNIKNLKG